MTKLSVLALPVAACMCAVSLLSADFWQSKPYTEWNDKDVQKLLQSSPWAKPVSVAVSGGAAGPANVSGLDGFSGLGAHKGVNPGGSAAPGAAPVVSVIVRWQSARPVREAVVKAKYGNEAGTSPEAKKALEEPMEHYVISLCGLPQTSIDSGDFKTQMLAQGMLVIKGRDPIKPVDFVVEGAGRTVMFVFPKTTVITEEDKEAEFVIKTPDFAVRQKFHLKEMLYNGKLDL